MEEVTVPTVDLLEPQDVVTQKIHKACKEWGFFIVINYETPSQDLLKRFDEQMRLFFELPREVKAEIKRTKENSRGWFDDELTKQKPDWKECLDIGGAGRSEIDGENQWLPDDRLPGFRATVEEYFSACADLSLRLVSKAGEGLGLPPRSLDPFFEDHTSFIRLNRYPPCPNPAPADWTEGEPDTERDGYLCINKHTDAGALTVLRVHTDEPASLQVLKDDRWHRVPQVEGGLVINVGDMMQVWSNDVYRAPVHRVLADPSQGRTSAPFFLNPCYDAKISPQTFCPPTSSSSRVTADPTSGHPDKGLEASPAGFSTETQTEKQKTDSSSASEGLRSPTSSVASKPLYRPFSWGEFRRRRFEGDFADLGKEVQISDWKIAA